MRTNMGLMPFGRATLGLVPEVAGYPPFDVEDQGDSKYRITLAVAGFRPDELEVVAQQNQLTVTGKRGQEQDQKRYLHQGIAARAFERRFELADFVEVRSANFDNGLLHIDLERVVPEAMKPRKIEIGEHSHTPSGRTAQLEHSKAA